MSQKKVLLTGAAGNVGQALLPFLREKYIVSTFDCVAVPGDPEAFIGNLADYDSVLQAVRGQDAIIHLAANHYDAPFVEEMVPNNIIGPHHVLEAAVECGVRRVLFASSCFAIQGHPRGHVVEADDPYRPTNIYGVTKAYGEVLGRRYSLEQNIEFIAIRIGWLLFEGDPRIDSTFGRSLYISPRDLADLFIRALEKPDVEYLTVFATSNVLTPRVSLRTAREELGYEPKDSVAEALERMGLTD